MLTYLLLAAMGLRLLHGLPLLYFAGFIAVVSLVALRNYSSFSSSVHRLSSCGPWALEHRLSSCVTGLVAPRHVSLSGSIEPVCPALAVVLYH